MNNLERKNTYAETFQNVGSRAALALALTACAAAPQQPTEPAQPARDKTNIAEIWADDHTEGPADCKPIEWKVGESPNYPVLYKAEDGMFLSQTAGNWSILRYKIADADQTGENYTAVCPQPGLEGEALRDFIRVVEDERVVVKAAVNNGKEHREEAFRRYGQGSNFQTYVHEATDEPMSWKITYSSSKLGTSHSNNGLRTENSSTPLRSSSSSEPLKVESSGVQK